MATQTSAGENNTTWELHDFRSSNQKLSLCLDRYKSILAHKCLIHAMEGNLRLNPSLLAAWEESIALVRVAASYGALALNTIKPRIANFLETRPVDIPRLLRTDTARALELAIHLKLGWLFRETLVHVTALPSDNYDRVIASLKRDADDDTWGSSVPQLGPHHRYVVNLIEAKRVVFLAMIDAANHVLTTLIVPDAYFRYAEDRRTYVRLLDWFRRHAQKHLHKVMITPRDRDRDNGAATRLLPDYAFFYRNVTDADAIRDFVEAEAVLAEFPYVANGRAILERIRLCAAEVVEPLLVDRSVFHRSVFRHPPSQKEDLKRDLTCILVEEDEWPWVRGPGGDVAGEWEVEEGEGVVEEEERNNELEEGVEVEVDQEVREIVQRYTGDWFTNIEH